MVSSTPSEGLRKNWLEQVAGGFQISATLRERVLFGRHDVLADPPFGNIDILCCRNLFIYLNARGQRLALTNFRRAMSDGAYLVLGRDESLPDVAVSWQVVSAQNRIYRTPERAGRFEGLEGAAAIDAQALPAKARQFAGPATLLDSVTPPDPSHAAALSDLRTAYVSLRCVNEELQTLNDELRSVNVLLEQAVARERDAATELHALIASSSQPLLVVDTTGCVEHFSKSAMSLFRLRTGDEGRALGDFANDLRWPELDATLRRSAADGAALSLEVADIRGGHWLATVTAVRAAAPSERKVLLSLADVSRLRDAVHLQAVLDAMPQQVAVLDAQGHIEQVNRAWRTFGQDNGADPAKTDMGVNYLQSSQPAELECDSFARQAAQGVRQVLSGSMGQFRMRYPCPTPKREAWFVLDVVPLSRPGGGCVVSHTEVTDLLRSPGVN